MLGPPAGSTGIMAPPREPPDMEPKKRLAYNLACAGLAFVGVFHLVFSTLFGYGFRQVSALLVAAAVFGLVLVNA